MTVMQDSADIDLASFAATGGDAGIIRIDDDGRGEVGPWVVHGRPPFRTRKS